MNTVTDSGYNHIVSGRLVYDEQPVANKQVEVGVNGTAKAIIATQTDGSYSVTLKLQPANNNPTTYQIEIAFCGNNALNLTAWLFCRTEPVALQLIITGWLQVSSG